MRWEPSAVVCSTGDAQHRQPVAHRAGRRRRGQRGRVRPRRDQRPLGCGHRAAAPRPYFDRTLLVLPPDAPAREAILRYHLRDRPIESVDLGKLVKVTEDLSGADLAHLCESASERALLDSTRTGVVRMINMKDLLGAAKEIRPSTDPWFASARNVAMFANEGGMYDELLAYLKRKRRL